MNDEKEQLIFAGRTVDIELLQRALEQTAFELVINPITGARYIVNRHEVKRPPNNVVQFTCEGRRFLHTYKMMTGE